MLGEDKQRCYTQTMPFTPLLSSFSVAFPFKLNEISADNLCARAKHHFPPPLCFASCAAVGKANSHFLLRGDEWVHLFLEDRERRVKGLQRESRNQMQPGTLTLRSGRSAGVWVLQLRLGPGGFWSWVRGRKGVLLNGAPHGGAGMPQGAQP